LVVRPICGRHPPHLAEDITDSKLQLNLDELKVTTFEAQQTAVADPSREGARSCFDTACPPYHCCAE
jgi:hypothetical protein